jgi:transcriptional regulator
MYNAAHFKEADARQLIDFMRQHPFALLSTSNGARQVVATQVPLLLTEHPDGRIGLRGHVMRKTDHHNALLQNPEVLCVFTGPHTYVSASWYTNTQVASTWNYMTVQARGQLNFLDDAGLLSVLKETTAHFENNPQSPARVELMTEEYVRQHMKAIQAFEITVTSLNHVFKLSQNHQEENYRRIIKQLQEQGGDGALIAAEMQKREQRLFGGQG